MRRVHAWEAAAVVLIAIAGAAIVIGPGTPGTDRGWCRGPGGDARLMRILPTGGLGIRSTNHTAVADDTESVRCADRAALPAAWLPQDTNFTLEGKITQRTEGKLTVSTEENIIFHVVYGEKTEIKRKDGGSGTQKDLQKGVKIKVESDLAESGEITARKIELE
jgi:hypothetical protein